MIKNLILCFILFSSILLKSQPQNGLVAEFLFNSNIPQPLDSGLKVYNATPTEDRFGNSNSAYHLQGNIDSYINLGTSNKLKPVKATISIWVRIDLPSLKGMGFDHNPILFTRSHIEDDYNEAYYIGYNFTTKNINVATTCSELNQTTFFPEEETSLRKWHHAVITYDNSYLCFYLDGNLEGKVSKKFQNCFLENDSVIVGNRINDRNQRFLLGAVDDILFYDRVLNPSEVRELYNAPNPNKNTIIINWIMWILASIAIILVIIWLIKLRVKQLVNVENEKNKLSNFLFEKENKLLSAQMNPHFIFNALNTIQHFIIINDNEKAQLYLTKFSRLIRRLLESSTKENISLKHEIEIFEKYIEIESLRFRNAFIYNKTIDPLIDTEKINIPHFLIQPIIENAIWHGLLPKDGEKKLQLTFKLIDDKTLSCSIEDNGVGRGFPKENNSLENKQSLAINFIKQRLEVLSKVEKREYTISTIDKVNELNQSTGTLVTINMPITKS